MVALTTFTSITGIDANSNPFVGTSSPLTGQATGIKTSTTIADNCILVETGMIGNRRGMTYFSNSVSATVDAFAEFQSQIIQHDINGTLWSDTNTGGSRTAYSGTYVAPSAMDTTIGRGSLFFTTTNGPYKLDNVAHTPIRSGMTKGLDVRATPTGTGSGFMNGYSQAEYRITWTRTDANNQTLTSDVSSPIVVTNNTRQTLTSLTCSGTTALATTPLAHNFNTGDQVYIAGATQAPYNGTFTITGTTTYTFAYTVAGSPASPATGTITAEKYMNVLIAFTAPWDVQIGDAWQVWRTPTATATTGGPGDTCYLVQQTTYTGSAGATISFTDTSADASIIGSTPLYTNATQQGVLQGNARPPMCSAMSTYKDYTIYANTAVDHQISVTMLATVNFITYPNTNYSRFVLTDVNTSRTYIAGTSENVSSQTFQVYTGGISPALNIQYTAQSLCHVINGDPNGHWYAEYTSGLSQSPGIMRIWARNPNTGQFWITAGDTTDGNQFSPILPTSGQSVASSNDARPNRLFYSKVQQPDHVPILNWIDIGQLEQPILRVISVRDACYVIKSDGVYTLTGLLAPFSLTELDTTCHCVAPRTAVALNNTIFMLSNQGVVKISLSGVTVISYDIEPIIMGTNLVLTNLSSVAFGCGHEVDRQYILFLPTLAGDTYATQAYVFHTFANKWVRWTLSAYAGIVTNSNFTLFLSSGIETAILAQRRTGTNADYSDMQLPMTITNQTGLTVTVTWSSSLFTPTAGLVITQTVSGNNVYSKVTAVSYVSGSTWTFTIDRSVNYNNASANVFLPIYANMRMCPTNCQQPGVVKSFYEVIFMLAYDTVSQATLTVATTDAPQLSPYLVQRAITNAWGYDSWGNVGWGDVVSVVRTIPWAVSLPIPDMTGEAVIAGWTHNVAQEQFMVAQIAVVYDVDSAYSVIQ